MNQAQDADGVGSLGEEAAKLLGALSGWAREHAGETAEGLSGIAAQALASAPSLDDHLATGAPACTVCPICRTVHAIRELSPEVREHLASAITSLSQAAAALLATTVPPHEDPGQPGVEHIDVDSDWPDEV